MTILGIGLPEISLIVILALILFSPKDMQKAGRTIGRTLRAFIMSPVWQAMRTTGTEIQQLPTKLMREAGLEEIQSELQKTQKGIQVSDQATQAPTRSVETQLLEGFTFPTPDSPPPQPEAGPKTLPTTEK